MFRIALVLIALVTLSADIRACERRRPLRNLVAAVVPGNRYVERHRTVIRDRTPHLIVPQPMPARPCGPMGCPAVPAKK